MRTRSTYRIRACLLAFSGLGAVISGAFAQDVETRPAGPEEAAVEIGVGEARLLPVSGVPKTIIVGDDTTIAANIIQEDILVFTGIAHGRTNVIVLDSSGRVIEQVWVSVIKSGAPLTVRRGIATEEFRCDPACRPEDEGPAAPSPEETDAVPG